MLGRKAIIALREAHLDAVWTRVVERSHVHLICLFQKAFSQTIALWARHYYQDPIKTIRWHYTHLENLDRPRLDAVRLASSDLDRPLVNNAYIDAVLC